MYIYIKSTKKYYFLIKTLIKVTIFGFILLFPTVVNVSEFIFLDLCHLQHTVCRLLSFFLKGNSTI